MSAEQSSQPAWKALVAEKRARQQASIPSDWFSLIEPHIPSADTLDVSGIPDQCTELLSEREREITNTLDVQVLLAKLASGTWSSVEVTTAFYKRAIIAQNLTNCLTEIFVEQALARAAEVDEYLKKTGKPMGPLHGLPVSLKDQICIKGLETTMGYVSWIGKYAERDAALVEILYKCGAVPFVRTNVPQTLMWPETFNNVFGRTVNPHNRLLTCGGSSGGEGALVAMRGSPLGVGSDIGGSIRIPSAMCGVYGLRPSYNRIPYEGAVNSLLGQDSVPSVLGPLANSISGLKAFTQAVVSAEPWRLDPLCVRKKWDEDAYRLSEHGGGERMCFAVMWDDGVVKPHPPVIRGLEMVKKALEAKGHKVIDWVPWKHSEMIENLSAIWAAGAAEDYAVTTQPTGEPILASMTDDAMTSEAPFRPSHTDTISAYQLWQLHLKKQKLRKEYLDRWEATVEQTGTGRPVDAIIAPVSPWLAPPHGKNTNCGFTMVWNLLDYAALVIPVSKLDEKVDVKQPPHKFLSKEDENVYNLYEPATFKNAPIAVQVVGRTLEEEGVIGMAELVDAALKDVAR
ncbi:amidase [Gloeophyllum trabeum ATCC 11539]|uniref:amidase n=1 Tax=Gloeophyllum trabeum (strain ATCC 11539 / FP-39264 / Madison 617) TaxID=670483 RepID=S7QAZ0_GLOTA|nr:amidase [Gloeophyllum trabeum ATCC 11539]EPQ57091.1 amidase [Gloeophyllum trabeum ATCC 11539]